MDKMERFEDALTELAKVRTTGHNGDHYAYMSGYLLGLMGEMTRNSDEARRLLERSLRDTEEMLFRANELRVVDSFA